MIVLDIARAPYTALMEITMSAEDFTFAGVEQALSNGLTTIVSHRISGRAAASHYFRDRSWLELF